MAECTLDLSRPCFIASLENLPEGPEAKQAALESFRSKVEKDHRCCHRVVQKFYGNKKYTHLHDKIWKYDWGESSASSRKAWRMIVVVPDPLTQPYNLIAAAVYTKNVHDQLSFAELSSIFDNATRAIDPVMAAGGSGDFRQVPNGDGKTRSICCLCYAAVAVHDDPTEIEKAEKEHRCDLAADPDLDPAQPAEPAN